MMIEKDRMSTNFSKSPMVTGPFEVEYGLKSKKLMYVIKILTSYQMSVIRVQNQASDCKFR